MGDYSVLSHIKFNCPSRVEVVKKMSSVAITNPITNVEFAKNNSMYDTRMGAFRNVKCGTCKSNTNECPGHHGHIPLIEPCLNSYYIKTTLKQILALYCFGCFQKDCVCVDEDEETGDQPPLKKRKKDSLRSVIKLVYLSNNYIKRLCGRKVAFRWESSTCHDDFITIKVLYMLISQISMKVYLADFPHFSHLGNLTESVFIHDLLVLPIPCRPPNMMNGEWKAENISRLYINIIIRNISLRTKRLIAIGPLVEEYHNLLQSAIDILFDIKNTNLKLQPNILQNGGIRQRVDGKEGRLRKNLMGKRVEFSARTVLSGDPKLGINEVGIPREIAENLTVPIKVTQYNLHKIGDYKLKYIFKADGRKYDTKVSNNYMIEIGDTVERCLINGDIVAINRQPTLHRGSIIACYIRIFSSKTFRLNYSTMITLNADTDGDEINLHVPQDLESRAELETLMLASYNIVCSQACKPLVGCTQDSLLGCYRLSQSFLSEHDFMAILYEMGLDDDFLHPCVIKGRSRLYSGNRLLTKAMEAVGVMLKRYEPNSSFLMIDNYVIKGLMNKAILGTADNSIIHHIYLIKGHIAAGKFIHLMQTAASAFLDIDGFSVGISDCIVDHDEINFDGLEDHLKRGFFKNNGKWTEKDESALCDALSELTKLPAPSNNSILGNRLLDMIVSGSKGSMMNFNQITNVVGQQIESEGRISKRFSDNTRTLPHFTRYDTSAGSRGLVKNSFLKGLSPQEFFMHAMGGRVGLIDTACKTAKTGDQYRRLVKSLEPLIIKDVGNGQRMVVDSSNGNIVQMNYGENDFDGTYLKTLTE
jgi:DNA-directed RNA polymerase II subunit RPB1